MVSPYKKAYADLSVEEKDMVDTSQQVLKDGNTLHGLGKDDLSHIEYAVGLALTMLGDLYEGDPLAIAIEIGLDDEGFFATFITKEEESE